MDLSGALDVVNIQPAENGFVVKSYPVGEHPSVKVFRFDEGIEMLEELARLLGIHGQCYTNETEQGDTPTGLDVAAV